MLFTEVNNESFYAEIGRRNVHPRIVTNGWPYTSEMVTPSGMVVGKIVGYIPKGEGLSKNKYFIPTAKDD